MRGRAYPVLGRSLPLLFALALTGCVTTTTLAHPEQLNGVQDPPNRLLVQLRGDSAWVPVIQHRSTPDSLFGRVEGSAAPGTPLRPLEVPFDSVTAIRLQRRDVARAAAIPAVTGVVVAMAAWILVSP